MLKQILNKLTLKSFTIISIVFYILVILLVSRFGIFSIDTSRTPIGYHSDYRFSLLGYLLFNFPIIYGAVGVRLAKDINSQGRIKLVLMIVYILSLIVLGFMILEWDGWNGGIFFSDISKGSQCLQALISTVVMWLGMSYGNA